MPKKPSEFTRSRKTFNTMIAAERALDQEVKSTYDFRNSGEVRQYHRDRRRRERQAKLNFLLGEDRVCPLCRESKIGSRAWVIIQQRAIDSSVLESLVLKKFCKEGEVAVCRSCYFRGVKEIIKNG